MNQAVPARLALRLGAQDPGGEGAELSGQILLAQPLVRPGADVVDENARGQLNGGWQGAAGGAGEDLDRDTDVSTT
jgi:hypothetical protein